MKKIKMLIALFSSAALVFACGCSEKNKSTNNNIVYYDSSNSYSQEAEGVENADGDVVKEEPVQNIPTTPVNLGENAQLSGLDIKLTNVYDAGIIEADQTYNYDRQVVVMVYEVANNTSEDVDVTAFDMTVRYMDGEETNITTGMEAMLMAGEKITDTESLNATLKPGETVKGYSAFAVYSRWHDLTVYYNPESSDNIDSLTFEVTKDMLE